MLQDIRAECLCLPLQCSRVILGAALRRNRLAWGLAVGLIPSVLIAAAPSIVVTLLAPFHHGDGSTPAKA
jgi:hypothetical protein